MKRTSENFLFLILTAFLSFLSPAYAPFCAAAEQPVTGDLDGDGNVTLDDVAIVLEAMTSGQYDPRADISRNGKVDQEDLDTIHRIFEKSTGQKAGAN